jgi:hypothetical protein
MWVVFYFLSFHTPKIIPVRLFSLLYFHFNNMHGFWTLGKFFLLFTCFILRKSTLLVKWVGNFEDPCST